MRLLALIFLISTTGSIKSNVTDDSLAKKTNTISLFQTLNSKEYCRNVVGILNPLTQCNQNYVFDESLYQYKIDTVPQVKFWRSIMNLHQDSALICIVNNRCVVEKVSLKDWNQKSDSAKKYYKDSIRCAMNIDTNSRILLTSGKKFFYDFDKTSLNFEKGIHCFIENGVDPWYAQAILLIESPNKLQKSNVGAYGSFQLMKDVARLYGLKVNERVDERADFDRSAYAASSLIKSICIPRAQIMLDSLKIANYTEEELWFRLLVMHIYHAGAYNVQKALYSFAPKEGNMELIYTLWQTQAGRFKSSSQNYSQLVLAAMLEMDERMPYLPKEQVLNAIGQDSVKISGAAD
jgi:hypothetical protein